MQVIEELIKLAKDRDADDDSAVQAMGDAKLKVIAAELISQVKKIVPARAAFDENLTHDKAEIPQLFWFNTLLIASNDTDRPA